MYKQHKTQVRVYFGDTDAVSVVYHANYLDFAERARTEMCRICGLDFSALAKKGQFFVVRTASLDYISVAKLDDLLDIQVSIEKFGNTSMTVLHKITNSSTGAEVCNVSTVLVFIQMQNGKATPVKLTEEARSCFFK